MEERERERVVRTNKVYGQSVVIYNVGTSRRSFLMSEWLKCCFRLKQKVTTHLIFNTTQKLVNAEC